MALGHALQELALRKRHLHGLGVLRVIAGSAIVYEYLHVYSQRGYLFGPNGVSPNDYASLSLYGLVSERWQFEALYHMGALVTLVWTIGVSTRWLTPLTVAFWWSLQRTNPGIWDGGDNLMHLVLVYCCFADVGQRWSIVPRTGSAVNDGSLSARLATLTHNSAVLAIALQLSVLYTVAGTTKMAGESWRNGTALYYALRPAEFYLPGVSEGLWSSRELLTVAAYGTMYVQAAFPLLLFLNKYSRRVVIVLMVGFHLGIIAVMGLITFGLFMIAVDLSLVTDREYQSMGNWLRHMLVRTSWAASADKQSMERSMLK